MHTLVLETDPILKEKVEPFEFSTNSIDLEELINSMVQFMVKKHGIGLAAPQIGLSLNMFVIGDLDKYWTCFNPKIIHESLEKVKIIEGCLSFPGLYLPITRPEKIMVQYQNIKGDIIEEQFEGILSCCYQHELDHLQGIVFTTKVGPTTLALGRSRRQKYLRRNKR